MKTYVIAEAGVNHNGSLKLAKELVYQAKYSGADSVKFQTFKAENLVTEYAGKADYQAQNTNSSETQLDMLKKLELSFDDFKELKEYCEVKGIDFMSTPFDDESIKFLDNLGMKVWKIPSGEITNVPYLIKIARLEKKIILSTGMSSLEEVEFALSILKKYGAKDIRLLHCTTEYPAPYEDVNLRAMQTMREKFGLEVGYSDHTKGIEVSIAAVALGATVIEKHFTLDKEMEGPDHKASLSPEELEKMVLSIRNIEKAMGNPEKLPSKSEIKNMAVARKSIVAKVDIKKGELFTEENLTVKRPGTGISPVRWFEVMGKESERDYRKDELIEE